MKARRSIAAYAVRAYSLKRQYSAPFSEKDNELLLRPETLLLRRLEADQENSLVPAPCAVSRPAGAVRLRAAVSSPLLLGAQALPCRNRHGRTAGRRRNEQAMRALKRSLCGAGRPLRTFHSVRHRHFCIKRRDLEPPHVQQAHLPLSVVSGISPFYASPCYFVRFTLILSTNSINSMTSTT